MTVEDLVRQRAKLKDCNDQTENKLLSLEEARLFVCIARELGKTTLLAEGTWDLTHAGHVQHLRAASEYCDLILLRLASAQYASTYKGIDRPIEVHREMVVSEFESVDGVWVDQTAISPDDIKDNAKILAYLNPDMISIETNDDKYEVKSASVRFANNNLGANIKPVLLTLKHINSTSNIINKIKNLS